MEFHLNKKVLNECYLSDAYNGLSKKFHKEYWGWYFIVIDGPNMNGNNPVLYKIPHENEIDTSDNEHALKVLSLSYLGVMVSKLSIEDKVKFVEPKKLVIDYQE